MATEMTLEATPITSGRKRPHPPDKDEDSEGEIGVRKVSFHGDLLPWNSLVMSTDSSWSSLCAGCSDHLDTTCSSGTPQLRRGKGIERETECSHQDK